ncbi:MAG: zinc ribbon domain-containing protein [Armatimonadetes bacterium]|nr:zinc ribbon domain-containing protein [Armatimonadota bacterium]
MPCPRCGTEVPSRSKFCLSCGLPLRGWPASEAAPPVGPEAAGAPGSPVADRWPALPAAPLPSAVLPTAPRATDEALEPTVSQEGFERIPSRFARRQGNWLPALIVGLLALALVGGFFAVWLKVRLDARPAAPVVAVVPGEEDTPPTPVVVPAPPGANEPNPAAAPLVPSPARGPSVVTSPRRDYLPGAPVLAPNQVQGPAGPSVVGQPPGFRGASPPVFTIPVPEPSPGYVPPPPRPRAVKPPVRPLPPQPGPPPAAVPPIEDIRPYLAWLQQMEIYRRWVYYNAVGLRLEMPAQDLQRLLTAMMQPDEVPNPAADVGFLRYKLIRLQQVKEAAAQQFETVRRVQPPARCTVLHQTFLGALRYVPHQIEVLQQQQVAYAQGNATAAIAQQFLAAALDPEALRALAVADQELQRVLDAYNLRGEFPGFTMGPERSWMR